MNNTFNQAMNRTRNCANANPFYRSGVCIMRTCYGSRYVAKKINDKLFQFYTFGIKVQEIKVFNIGSAV